MKFALDTNVLVYAEGFNDVRRRDIAVDLIQRLPRDAVVIPVQVLGELFNVLVRKAGQTHSEAREALLYWRSAFQLMETSAETLLSAVDLATDHHLGVWDAIVLSAAAQAGCSLLLSEDLQEGFTWGGVTVTNPFAPTRHVLLDALLNESSP